MAKIVHKKQSVTAAIAITGVSFLFLTPMMVASPISIISVILMYGLAWYGWIAQNKPDMITVPIAKHTQKQKQNGMNPVVEPDDEVENPLVDVDREITKASRIADSDDAVTALHRFRRSLAALLTRDFRDDVGNELDTIVERDFPDLVSRYVSAKERASWDEGKEADSILASSVRRLTSKVAEIVAQQNQIENDRLRDHGEFLRQRHPVESDPFSSIGNAGR